MSIESSILRAGELYCVGSETAGVLISDEHLLSFTLSLSCFVNIDWLQRRKSSLFNYELISKHYVGAIAGEGNQGDAMCEAKALHGAALLVGIPEHELDWGRCIAEILEHTQLSQLPAAPASSPVAPIEESDTNKSSM